MKAILKYIILAGFIFASLWFSSCKPKNICPAYQSAFYLDPKLAEEEFSPFDKDSMPKLEETVKKTDVLLVIRLGKKKINKRMAIIPMITVFPAMSDSALAMADSLAADSALMEQEMGDEIIEDSSDMAEPEFQEQEEAPIDDGEIDDQEIPKPEMDIPKPVKKVDLKDPELSDPTLKAEFEESFDDAPSFEEDENAPPPPDPEPPKKSTIKKGPKKAEKKEGEEKPKEDAADDQF